VRTAPLVDEHGAAIRGALHARREWPGDETPFARPGC
jgi:hypothetical protein